MVHNISRQSLFQRGSLGENPPLDPGMYLFEFGRGDVHSRSLILLSLLNDRLVWPDMSWETPCWESTVNHHSNHSILLYYLAKIRRVKCILFPRHLLLAFLCRNCLKSTKSCIIFIVYPNRSPMKLKDVLQIRRRCFWGALMASESVTASLLLHKSVYRNTTYMKWMAKYGEGWYMKLR